MGEKAYIVHVLRPTAQPLAECGVSGLLEREKQPVRYRKLKAAERIENRRCFIPLSISI